MTSKKKLFYLSQNLSIDKTGGTLVAKSNLKLLEKHQTIDVTAYSISRNPIPEAKKITPTSNKLGTALSNLHGLCGMLSTYGRKQFLHEVFVSKPDYIWLDSSLFGSLIPAIREVSPRTKIMTYFHNVESDLIRQKIKNGELYYLPTYLATQVNEKLSAIGSDLVFSITSTDGERIQKKYKAKTFTLPISLDSSKNFPPPLKKNSREVLFVGSEFWPNIEGLRFLNDQVAPLLKNATILVVGKGLERHLKGKSHPRLKFLDYVENIEEVYQRAQMTVAPIFSGGGMKVKIAESLMHNRAVISTTFAAIGYEKTDSDSITTANDPRSFASKIDNWSPSRINQPIQDFLAFYSFQSNIKKIREIANKVGIEI